jgi:hypothetical protein
VSVAVPTRAGLRARARGVPAWAVTALGAVVLLAISLRLRTTSLGSPFWIDEGLSVGIASHGFLEIPGVLRLDGSPPLYYLQLHVWMALFGDGQTTTHVLSLGWALLSIPALAWGAGSLFGRRAAWYAAALAAVNPFLTYYAQETRMYAMVATLSAVVAATFVHAFVLRRRRHLWVFAAALTALIYTHNWGLFLATGTVVALAPCWFASGDRRGLLGDAVRAYGVVGLLYLPWVPTLLFQAANTGAPWSVRPNLGDDIFGPISNVLGEASIPFGLALAAGAGLAVILGERRTGAAFGVGASAAFGAGALAPAPSAGGVRHPRSTAVLALILLPVAALVVAWTASQFSPAYTSRYWAVFVGPLLLLSAIGLAHAGRLGLVALLIIFALWLNPRSAELQNKSDVRLVAAKLQGQVFPGDLVVSVHPEHTPVLHYYFPEGLRYADAIGMVGDPRVFDWRNALDRLRAAKPTRVLDSYVSSLRPGQTLILTLPIIRTGSWNAPWTGLVRKRSAQWQRAADRHPELVRIAAEPRFRNRRLPRGVRTVLYRKAAEPRPVDG